MPSALEKDASDLMAWVIVGHRPPEAGFRERVTVSPLHSPHYLSLKQGPLSNKMLIKTAWPESLRGLIT